MLRKVLINGYTLATQAAEGKNIQVFADIGPVPEERAAEEYSAIAAVFLEMGASHFLFETLGGRDALRRGISAN